MAISKIISGGQSGVDRAALDVALETGISCGGWCPSNRIADDGVIPNKYPMWVLETGGYRKRTERNVRDSDGTLILNISKVLSGGTLLTANLAQKYAKPLLVIDLDDTPSDLSISGWLNNSHIATLNIAGPSETTQPGIYAKAFDFLAALVASFG